MTGEEHILYWVESSKSHYDRLLRIARPGNFHSDINRAHACTMLAANALQDMVKCGDAYRRDHDASSVLRAAVLFSEWKEPI